MKKTFTKPEISICAFATEDIITTSAIGTAVSKAQDALGGIAVETVTSDWDSME
jgi:hypothetical protein